MSLHLTTDANEFHDRVYAAAGELLDAWEEHAFQLGGSTPLPAASRFGDEARG